MHAGNHPRLVLVAIISIISYHLICLLHPNLPRSLLFVWRKGTCSHSTRTPPDSILPLIRWVDDPHHPHLPQTSCQPASRESTSGDHNKVDDIVEALSSSSTPPKSTSTEKWRSWWDRLEPTLRATWASFSFHPLLYIDLGAVFDLVVVRIGFHDNQTLYRVIIIIFDVSKTLHLVIFRLRCRVLLALWGNDSLQRL